MGKKTINQALKDLFLGLGGDSSALADNSSVSDYIEDLESAIKGAAAGAQIDDTTASETSVYSSSKVESLIPTDELPSVTSEDIGEVLTVVSDGESGAEWGKAALTIPQEVVSYKITISDSTVTLPSGVTIGDIMNNINAHKDVVLYTEFQNKPKDFFRLYGVDDNSITTATTSKTAFICIKGAYNVNYNIEIQYVYFASSTTGATTMSYFSHEYSPLPEVSATDNDKILKVVNGKWAAVLPQ